MMIVRKKSKAKAFLNFLIEKSSQKKIKMKHFFDFFSRTEQSEVKIKKTFDLLSRVVRKTQKKKLSRFFDQN